MRFSLHAQAYPVMLGSERARCETSSEIINFDRVKRTVDLFFPFPIQFTARPFYLSQTLHTKSEACIQ